jgi:hypothetical protein
LALLTLLSSCHLWTTNISQSLSDQDIISSIKESKNDCFTFPGKNSEPLSCKLSFDSDNYLQDITAKQVLSRTSCQSASPCSAFDVETVTPLLMTASLPLPSSSFDEINLKQLIIFLKRFHNIQSFHRLTLLFFQAQDSLDNNPFIGC